MDKGIHIILFGHNDHGFIGFIHGTNELVYLEKPSNWEKLAEEAGLRYISHEDVKKINADSKKINELTKGAKKSRRKKSVKIKKED